MDEQRDLKGRYRGNGANHLRDTLRALVFRNVLPMLSSAGDGSVAKVCARGMLPPSLTIGPGRIGIGAARPDGFHLDELQTEERPAAMIAGRIAGKHLI